MLLNHKGVALLRSWVLLIVHRGQKYDGYTSGLKAIILM